MNKVKYAIAIGYPPVIVAMKILSPGPNVENEVWATAVAACQAAAW